jgi:aflatoxin B1 aldehyde reductase
MDHWRTSRITFVICLLAYICLTEGGLLVGNILDEDSLKNTKGGRWDPSVSHMAPLLHEQCKPLLPILRELKELLVRKGYDS